MQTISFSFSQIVNVVILPNITLYEFFIFLMVVSIPLFSLNFFFFICFLKNINEKKIVTTKAEKINTNIYIHAYMFFQL